MISSCFNFRKEFLRKFGSIGFHGEEIYGLKIKEQYKLETGKSLPNHHLKV